MQHERCATCPKCGWEKTDYYPADPRYVSVPIVWSMYGVLDVEIAGDETLSDAVRKAIKELPTPPGNYLDDSCRVDEVGLYESNPGLSEKEIQDAVKLADEEDWLG